MNITSKKTEDGSIDIVVTIPWKTVESTFAQVLGDLSKTATIPGFRKGKAPKKITEKNIETSKIYEEVLKKIVPTVYRDIITKQNIRPITPPKITLKEAKEKKDWVLNIITCERPIVHLGEYKKVIQTLKSEKKEKIWVPGQKEESKDKNTEKVSLDDIFRVLLSCVKVTIPLILIEQEITRLLSDLVDRTRQLGLTIDQYLQSKSTNLSALKQEYHRQAEQTYILEFILEEIANKENITAENKDIEEIIKQAKTDEERKAFETQRYYLAALVRKQKTIAFLSNL